MKFNIIKKGMKTIRNHEGAEAYKLSPQMELYVAVVTGGLSDRTYEKADVRLARIQALIRKNDPVFVAKLAIYCRTVLNMRSLPSILAVELAKSNSGSDLVSKTVSGVVKRADEIGELLAYYQVANDRNDTKKLNRLSKQIQKGLAESFNRFDAYQLAKYNRNTEVKLKDALFLVHPKAKDAAQQAVFDQLAKDELEVPYTWETELTAFGQQKFENAQEKALALKAKWEELIDSGKIGYMAVLRNLRNILEANVSVMHVRKVCDYLSNAQAVANSKQMPFRFLAAYRELKTVKSDLTSMVLNALEEAVSLSVQHVKGFNEESSVVIACDVSGSMQKPISAKSKILLYDIGLMLGMILQSNCSRVITGMFGDTWKTIPMSRFSILNNVNEFYKREGEVGYSTNGYLVIEDLIERKVLVDKVMLFTDCQLWNSNGGTQSLRNAWSTYKAMNPKARLYLFDLAGYGNTPVSIENKDVFLIAGWSDKVFDLLQAIEEGKANLQKINELVL